MERVDLLIAGGKNKAYRRELAVTISRGNDFIAHTLVHSRKHILYNHETTLSYCFMRR